MSTHSASTAAPDFRPAWLAAPLLAMIYPLPLTLFHALVGVVQGGGGLLAWAMAGICLALAILAPLFALWMSIRLAAIARPSPAEIWARRAALLAVAAPPLYTAPGAWMGVLGVSIPDLWLFIPPWLALMAVIARAGRDGPVPLAPVSGGRLRVAHGVIATFVLATFLLLHIGNHLLGLDGPDAHKAAMKSLRLFYRTMVIEPLLLAAFLALALSGLRMAWRISSRPMDGFRTLQIASGIFLALFLSSHVTAVVPLARLVLGIDPNWDFATGAPMGLIRDAWSIRLVPYYLLAVFFALSHALAGARGVMLAHGTPRRLADGIMSWGMALSALIAVIIILAMCGLRLHFE